MHDLKFIREHKDAFDAGLARRGLPPMADDILAIDKDHRAIQTELQELQAMRNDISKKIGEMKRAGQDTAQLMEQVANSKDKTVALEAKEKEIAGKVETLLASIPNIPAPDVPDGVDEKGNVERVDHRFGEPTRVNSSKEHYEIGEALGLMDFDTAAKLSGSRFTLLKGPLAQMERALANFMLDIHTREHGYTEMSPPLMVRSEIMFGTGQLPKFADDQFLAIRKPTDDEFAQIKQQILEEHEEAALNGNEPRLEYKETRGDRHVFKLNAKGTERLFKLQQEKSLWLIPTAEVPLTNTVYDSILDEAELPKRYVAKTPCFRAEAGAAGKDTRGMIRQHQFYKVELVSITTPDKSAEEHERMTASAENILKKLKLPFRTMTLCAGDMGFSAQKTYDIEVWLPGQNAYREISSCSNCGDFQARRMKARFRKPGDKNTHFLHTLNGSGVAVGRCLIAVLENYQQTDGSVVIPEALRPYMGGLERIAPVKA